MKKFIKVSTVSLVALALMVGSVGSATAGSKSLSLTKRYSSFQKSPAPRSFQSRITPQTNGGKPVVRPPNGGVREPGTLNTPVHVAVVLGVLAATAMAYAVSGVQASVDNVIDLATAGSNNPPHLNEDGSGGALGPRFEHPSRQ